MTTQPDKHLRPIRSFVRREGRITEAQKRALEELLPRYGVEPGAAPLDFVALFGRAAPVQARRAHAYLPYFFTARDIARTLSTLQ